MAVPALSFPFPCGLPYRTPGAGLWRLVPGVLPLTQVFRDWDFLGVAAGALRLTWAGGHCRTAAPGDLAIIPPFVPVVFEEAAPGLAFWYCHIAFHLPSEPAGNAPGAYRGPGAGRQLPALIRSGAAPAVAAAYRRMVAADPALPLWHWQRPVHAFIAALAQAAHAPGEADAAAPGVDARVAQVVALVERDPAHPWSAAGLARRLGLTPGHLNVLMGRHTGLGTKRYLMEARLRSSLRRLRDTDAASSIAEIAAACGFPSQHLFSRQFRSRFGLTPRAFRLGRTVS